MLYHVLLRRVRLIPLPSPGEHLFSSLKLSCVMATSLFLINAQTRPLTADDVLPSTVLPTKSASGHKWEIDRFMAKPEPDFAWRIVDERKLEGATVIHVNLASQRWQGILWQHALMVYEPTVVSHSEHMLLFVTGGSTGRAPGSQDVALGIAMANLCGARVAVLHQVPNQPLMDGRVEDDLITETWLKYLEAGDASWPLLFPMVKSAVASMDALEQLARVRDWPQPTGFVVSGASKRGWTSWLTAATDRRIKATAPMVIDMLNFPAQIRNQFELWGKPSEQIVDYTSKGLIREDGQPRPGLESKLWEMMDPYTYRNRVTIPKLLVVGASDRYWATDAMNLYWDDLQGDKYIFRGANAGHGLEGRRDQALQTLGVFFRHVASDASLPNLTWTPEITDHRIGIKVNSDQSPKESRLWVAHASTKDFRSATWQSHELTQVDRSWVGSHGIDNGDHVAIFAELVFEYEGIPYFLSTLAYYR